MKNLDVLITGGTVYDGVSSAGRVADVGIADGKIAFVSDIADPRLAATRRGARPAGRVIDAAGLAVMPGFIDVHSHSDLAWLVWPNATSKLLSGVTTDVSGNCGESAFPLAGETLARSQAQVARHGLTIDWSSAAEYFARLDATPCGVNRAVLVGHGNLRGVTVGYGNEKATAAHVARMRELLTEGLDAGAFGMSTGLIYPPGIWADSDEIAALVEVVAARGGYYTSHIRSERETGLLDAIDEFIAVCERTGCRGLISHLKTAGMVEALHARIASARSRGVDVWADRYPYLASCTSLAAIVLPSWAVEGTTQQMLARLIDPRDRQRITDEIEARGTEFFDGVMVTSINRPGLAELSGKTLTEIGKLAGKPPMQAALDLLVEDRLGPEAVHFFMSEDELRVEYSWPFVMIGSDYSARDALVAGEMCHPRAFGTPARFLASYVRDAGVCDLPTAAKKLATMPADMLGLPDRGRLAAGCWADVVVFDPARIEDRATYQQPRVTPAGIEAVVVNGKLAVDGGKFTGAHAGQVLRKGS